MKNQRLTWPILLLVLTVIVPSTGMVWMMREAMRNERLASDQRLRDAYQTQLQSAHETVLNRRNDRRSALNDVMNQVTPSVAFANLVERGKAESVLITDGQGQLLYPVDSETPVAPIAPSTILWDEAQRLEFEERRHNEAADKYRQVAATTPSERTRALAQQAEVRCLIQSNQIGLAIDVLDQLRQQHGIHDQQGRSLAASAEFRLLELLPPDSPRWLAVANDLGERLRRYDDDSLVSSQRQFLMSQLEQRMPEIASWPTRAAETLASNVIAADEVPLESSSAMASSLPDVWICPTPDARVIEIYRTETLRGHLLSLTEGIVLPPGIDFLVLAPDAPTTTIMDLSFGTDLAGWRLGLSATDLDPFAENSRHRRAVHLWIAFLVVAATAVLAWMLASTLRQRMRLAQLKNDLVATVSHELKTPLASIRLLVDTLLQSDAIDLASAKTLSTSPSGSPSGSRSGVELREYLQLISQENSRLTRLIDQFLSFSRLEQGKPIDEFQTVDLREVINRSTRIFHEHWCDAKDSVVIEHTSPSLVRGDLDALVTAVVNLLENAWKYSNPPKRITVGCRVDGHRALLEVSDNGIGLSAKDAGRVFDQFFQVDQRVARTHGGCGLGLSIVQGIARAHGGTVSVESQLDHGSTFTLEMPLIRNTNATNHSADSFERNP